MIMSPMMFELSCRMYDVWFLSGVSPMVGLLLVFGSQKVTSITRKKSDMLTLFSSSDHVECRHEFLFQA